MTKVAIYIRVSTETQVTDRQETELKEYAERNNLEVTDVYKDKMSGMKSDKERLGLHELINDAEEHKFDAILFSEFSRLSRRVLDLNTYIEKFRDMGIDLYFQKQNLWVKQKGDLATDILLQVLAIVSRYEIELFAERSISGRIEKIKNKGINQGGFTAYGYKSEERTKRLIIDKEEAEVIRQIFRMYTNDVSAYDILEYLNSNHIPTSHQKRIPVSQEKRQNKGLEKKVYNFDLETAEWNKSTLRGILRNKLYIGERNFKYHKPNIDKKGTKEVLDEIHIKDESLRIISDEVWDKAQSIIQYNLAHRYSPKKRSSLLGEFLECGKCGSSYVTSYRNKEAAYVCYKSPTLRKRKDNCTHSFTISQSKLDGLIIDTVFKFLMSYKHKVDTDNEIQEYQTHIGTNNEVIQTKEEEQKRLKTDWLNYFEKAVRYDIPEEKIAEYQQNTERKINGLKKEVDKLTQQNKLYEKRIKAIRNASSINPEELESYFIPENHYLIKQVLREYVDKIVIHNLGNWMGLVHIFMKNGWQQMVILKNCNPKKTDYAIHYLRTITDEEIVNQYITEHGIKEKSLIYCSVIELEEIPNDEEGIILSDEVVTYDKERNVFRTATEEYTPLQMYNECLATDLENFRFYTKFYYQETSK